MARKIDWERRRFDQKRTLSVKDESEFRKGDVAARWLAKAETEIAAKKRQEIAAKKQRAAEERAKPRTTPQRTQWQGKKLKPGEAPF